MPWQTEVLTNWSPFKFLVPLAIYVVIHYDAKGRFVSLAYCFPHIDNILRCKIGIVFQLYLAPLDDVTCLRTGYNFTGITQTRPCNIQQYLTAAKMLIFR